MTGDDYILLAKSLFQNSDEASRRCAISRYYYGLLHKTIKYIQLKGIAPCANQIRQIQNNLTQDHSIHTTTINCIKHSGVKGNMKIVKELRVWADYKFDTALNLPFSISIGNEEIRTFDTYEDIVIFCERTNTLLEDRVLK
jgi:hypothetical protein